MRNQDNIKGLAFMEAILSTWKCEDMPPQIVEFFQTMRGTSSRELLVDQNFFVEQVMPMGVHRELSDVEMDNYKKPFLDRLLANPSGAGPKRSRLMASRLMSTLP